MRTRWCCAAAHWVSAAPGGRGAVRELCDALLRARGPEPRHIMLFRIFTLIAVIALAVSTWILSSPEPPARGRLERAGQASCRAIT